MFKAIDYAILSNHVYNPHDDSVNGLEIRELDKDRLKNKKLPNGWYRAIDVDDSVFPQQLFYAALYVKFGFGKPCEAVVAIRGTNNFINKLSDTASWWSEIFFDGILDIWPPYTMKASCFFRTAYDYTKKHIDPNLNPILTGHSLGGALAQFIVGHMGEPTQAITFNSPGIGHMLGIKHSNTRNFVHNVNARYDFISHIGKSFGDIHYVDVLEKEAEAKRAWAEIREVETIAAELKAHPEEENPRILDKLQMTALLVKQDVKISLVPQHDIDNLIHALRATSVLLAA